MTDTQTMQDIIEMHLSDSDVANYRNGEAVKLCSGDLHAIIQAAWTRKPAAQVAGAEPKLGKLVPDSACKQGKCAMSTAGCWNGCELLKSRPLGGSYSVTIGTKPAPEQDATKVVSVPVPWEQRSDADSRANKFVERANVYMEAEIAEWRALAADRERT